MSQLVDGNNQILVHENQRKVINAAWQLLFAFATPWDSRAIDGVASANQYK